MKPSTMTETEVEVELVKENLEWLKRVCSRNRVFLITLCESDQEEAAAQALIASSGLLEAGLHPARVLFCSSSIGRIHMTRQLQPHLHIDEDEAVRSALQPHIPSIIATQAIQ